jgi:hypothetical protein
VSGFAADGAVVSAADATPTANPAPPHPPTPTANNARNNVFVMVLSLVLDVDSLVAPTQKQVEDTPSSRKQSRRRATSLSPINGTHGPSAVTDRASEGTSAKRRACDPSANPAEITVAPARVSRHLS